MRDRDNSNFMHALEKKRKKAVLVPIFQEGKCREESDEVQ